MANKTAIFFKKGKIGTSGQHIVSVGPENIHNLPVTDFF